MKKAKGIIALVVILLLLCGAYFYVSKHPKTVETRIQVLQVKAQVA